MFVAFQLILVKVLCKALPLICIKYEPQTQKRKCVPWTTKDMLLQFRDSFRCPILFSISGFLTTSRAQQPSTVVPLNRRCGWGTLAVFGQPPAVIRLMDKRKRYVLLALSRWKNIQDFSHVDYQRENHEDCWSNGYLKVPLLRSKISHQLEEENHLPTPTFKGMSQEVSKKLVSGL